MNRLHLPLLRLVLAPVVLLGVLALGTTTARAGVKSEAVEAAARYVSKKFGNEVTEELGEQGSQVLTARLGALAARYGEREAVQAAQKVGPRVFRLVDEAGGDHATRAAAVRLLGRAGPDAAWVVGRKQSMRLFMKHGDEAAEAMIKHKAIAEPLIDGFGQPAARALRSVSTPNARRLAMMADGDLAKIGRTRELMGVIGRYGDNGMNWVWRHKGALATAAVLTAFLNDPEPFINGTVDLAQVAGDSIIKPAVTGLAGGMGQRTNWTVVIPAVLGGATLLFLGRRLLRRGVATVTARRT